MTDEVDKNKNSTKVEGESKPAETATSSNEDEGLLSLEDLDSIISEDDPEFTAGLGTIGPNEEFNANIGDGFDLEYTLKDEEALWKHSGGLRSLIYKIFPAAPKLSFGLRRRRLKLRERILHSKTLLLNAGPWLLKWSKQKAKDAKTGLSESLRAFKFFSLKKKLGLVGVILLFFAALFVVYRSMTKGLFPPQEELFVGSLQEWSQEEYAYNPDTEVESFYESTHSSQNMVVVPKMVVNLRRSAGSGPNPMGAFEFYVQGSASDVVVEVKDREAEVTDLFQRSLEEMTYDQVASPEGKQLLTEKLRKEVNRILTKGKVRRIFIKTAIIKP